MTCVFFSQQSPRDSRARGKGSRLSPERERECVFERVLQKEHRGVQVLAPSGRGRLALHSLVALHRSVRRGAAAPRRVARASRGTRARKPTRTLSFTQVRGRDLILVQSMDGRVTFYEQALAEFCHVRARRARLSLGSNRLRPKRRRRLDLSFVLISSLCRVCVLERKKTHQLPLRRIWRLFSQKPVSTP